MSDPTSRIPRPMDMGSVRGILWMILSTIVFAVSDAMVKVLTQTYPLLEVAWARFALNVLFLILVFHRRLPAVTATSGLGRQLARSTLMCVMTILAFASLHLIPLANFKALMFVAPIFVTALSMPLLKERVGPRRWAAVLAGFAGALIIVRPDRGLLQPTAFVPLATAALLALYYLSTRWISRTDSAATTLFYTPLVGAVAFSVAVPFVWVTPDLKGWMLMLIVSVLGLAAHFTLIKAFEAAPAATVTPLNYLGIVWATFLGYALFSDLPDGWTLLGGAVVISSGLYILHREHRHRRSEGESS